MVSINEVFTKSFADERERVDMFVEHHLENICSDLGKMLKEVGLGVAHIPVSFQDAER